MCKRSSEYECIGDAEWLEPCNDVPTFESIDFDQSSIATSRTTLEETINRAFRTKVLKQIADLMQYYPNVPLIVTRNKISIATTAPDGFAMSVRTECGRYVVNLGNWRDELVHAEEAVELVERAMRGEIRLRIDIDARGQHYTAEQMLPKGDWIALPHCEDDNIHTPMVGPIRTLFLRNGVDEQ